MPIALEPGRRFPVVLERDKSKSPTPTFFAKSLSMREQQQLADVIDGIEGQERTSRQLFKEHIEALQSVLVDWSHMLDEVTGEMIQFDVSRINGLLDLNEARQLLRKVLLNGHVSLEEKKG